MAQCSPPRRLPLLLLLLGFLATSLSVRFEVKEASGGKNCIIADISANFSVAYSATGSKEAIRNFILPGDAVVHNSSTCGKNESNQLLAVTFGSAHIMSINFSRNALEYRVVELSLIYNVSDAAYFPNATDKGTLNVSSASTGIAASINTTYRCFHEDQINMGHVNVTLSDIKIEAFLAKNNFSDNETVCSKDVTPSTTPVPITSTTAKPTMPPTPTVGKYNISDGNGTCLLMSSGLQLNFTYLSKNNKTAVDVFAFDPTQVSYTGSCKPSPTVNFSVQQTTLTLNFFQNSSTNIFYLGSVSVNTTLPSDAKDLTFTIKNGPVSYLKTTLGKSYKCKAKQTLQITKEFSINTFDLQVQAFKVDGGKFGAVEECQLDENSMLVPIIVGAALAGLVLIVLIAYLIGRKRSHAGYQTI